MYSITKLVTMIKSLTAIEVFKKFTYVKKQLWGGEFWSDGYFTSTVGKHGDESMIRKYVKNQVIITNSSINVLLTGYWLSKDSFKAS